jgi:Flp pilus assembly protein TadG
VRRDRNAPDRGAAAVEFALILPVFLMLVFGLISAGIAYFHKIGLTNDVREAGRFGSTYVTSAGNPAATDASGVVSQVLQTAINDAGDSGDLRVTGTAGSYSLDPAAAANQVVCVAYISPTGAVTRQTSGSASLPSNPLSACYNDGLGSSAGYPRLQVYAQGFSRWNLLVVSSGPTVKYHSATVYRYERNP